MSKLHRAFDSKVLNKSAQECIAIATRIIRRLLLEQGGFENGFNTSMHGDIRSGVHQSIDWETPAMVNLTMKEIREIGYMMNETLIALIDKYLIDHVRIIAEPSDEYGGMKTSILIVEEFEVKL
jgi:hypothetical protein